MAPVFGDDFFPWLSPVDVFVELVETDDGEPDSGMEMVEGTGATVSDPPADSAITGSNLSPA